MFFWALQPVPRKPIIQQYSSVLDQRYSSGNLSEMKNFRLLPRSADLKLLEILMYVKVWEPLLCLWQQLSEIKTVLSDEIKLMAELSLWLRSCPFLNQYFRRAAFLFPKLKTWPPVFKKTKVKTEKNAFFSTNYFLNEDKSCINRSILLCISSREPMWLCVVCITFYCWEIFHFMNRHHLLIH